MELLHYLTPRGDDPFQAWLDGLTDVKGRVAVLRRIDRIAAGNFGDHKSVGHGVCELRIDHGPGYRVYFGRKGNSFVLLLCGGSKRDQSSDIRRAIEHWTDFQRRAS